MLVRGCSACAPMRLGAEVEALANMISAGAVGLSPQFLHGSDPAAW